MLRILISGCAVVVLLLSTFLLPQTALARRCPVKEPETLLSLYQSSHAIYVAAFDRTADEAIVEQNDDYTAVEISKHFTIISTLKGDPRKFLVLKDREYRYPEVVEVEADAEGDADEMEYEEEVPTAMKNGDQVLLFIDFDDEDGGPSLTDYRDGIKRLGTQEMGVYETRIRELHSIFNAKKVDENQVVEWLMRCADDPATLWEASYELLSSFQAAEWAEQRAERLKEMKEKGEPVDEEEAIELDGLESEEGSDEPTFFDTSVFPKILSDNHKQRLANILFEKAVEGGDEEEPEARKEVRGEEELIELVKRWGDDRLVPFLLDRLRGSTGNNWYSARIMHMAAELLDDEDAKALAEQYSDITGEDDADTVQAEDADEVGEDESGEAPEIEDQEANRPVDADAGDEPADEAAADDPPVKKKTYGELRAELLAKFLEHCDKLLTERAGEAEEAN